MNDACYLQQGGEKQGCRWWRVEGFFGVGGEEGLRVHVILFCDFD